MAARTKEQLQSALGSRDIIGQAKGMIMERFDVDAIRAFEMLAHLSQQSNTPSASSPSRSSTAGNNRPTRTE